MVGDRVAQFSELRLQGSTTLEICATAKRRFQNHVTFCGLGY
jgi:hypothetical protein